jgi:NAD+ synthase
MRFTKDILEINCENAIEKICNFINHYTSSMHRGGAVVGLSGGIDSALVAELCVKTLGKDKVFGLILPEKESSKVSKEYALRQAQKLGIKTETIDITPILETFGTYEKRDSFIKDVFPEYGKQYKSKITLPLDLLFKDALNFFTLTIDDGKGNVKSTRLKKAQLFGITSATSTKQRTRMMHLYYYAEKMNYFVCGTTNRSETIQGYYVKYGDGGVDIEPIAHLYKTQIYQLSEQLGVIDEIIHRVPSPDTYSYDVSDEEFFFRIPYDKLDLLLYAWENKVSIVEVCDTMKLTEDQVKRAFRDITAKFYATKHLRGLPPSLLNIGRLE